MSLFTWFSWFENLWFGFMAYYVGYLMPNPVYTYILYNMVRKIKSTKLNSSQNSYASLTIQINISH